MDIRLKQKVRTMVDDGIYNSSEIRRALDAMVFELFPCQEDRPPRTNRSFYPLTQDIANIVQRAVRTIT